MFDLQECLAWGLPAPRGDEDAGVASVCWSPKSADGGKRLLVGTRAGAVFEMGADDGKDLHGGPVVRTPTADGELWGLSAHPKDARLVATCGDDRTVRVWDLAQRKQVAARRFECAVRAVAYSPDGGKLAVGLGAASADHEKNGGFVVLDTRNLATVVHEGREQRQWIRDLAWSPDGHVLNIASNDHSIASVDATNKFAPRYLFSAHAAPVSHFDFSADGQPVKISQSTFTHLECGHRPPQDLNSADRIPAPVY